MFYQWIAGQAESIGSEHTSAITTNIWVESQIQSDLGLFEDGMDKVHHTVLWLTFSAAATSGVVTVIVLNLINDSFWS